MLRNHLATALRNLARNRLYAAINIIGLAVGFSAAILAMLCVRDEFSFDRWIPGYENLYRISPILRSPSRATPIDPSPEQTAAWLEADFPEVQAATRLSHPEQVSLRRLPVEGTEHLYWADPDFLDVVRLPLVAGDRTQALQQPDGLVITRKLARKYFGRDDPIGKYIELVLPRPGEPYSMRVMAVIEDLPTNSHFDIELLGSGRAAFSTLTMWDEKPQSAMDFSVRAHTYLRLNRKSDAIKLQQALPDFMKRHKPGNRAVERGELSFQLMPITKIHFAPDAEFMMKARGSLMAVYGIFAVAVLVVLTAIINYVNLTTARMARRNIEVGVRKAAGASRGVVFVQFIGESLVYCLFGTFVAIAFTELSLPHLNAFLQRDIRFDYWLNPQLAGGVVTLVLLTAFCGGGYPALTLAKSQPAPILKGMRTRAPGAGAARAVLVAAQFCILIVLIVSAGTVYRQTRYSMNTALRIDKEMVLLVENACSQEAFRSQVAALPNVRSTGCTSPYALNMDVWLMPIWRSGQTPVTTKHAPVDFGFFETYGIAPLAGRMFSRNQGADKFPDKPSTRSMTNVILNETAARRLGFVNPQQAIGQSITMYVQRDQPPSQAQVIGVVPDFQFSANRAAIDPTIYFIDRNASSLWHLSIKLSGARLPETLRAIDAAWRATGSPHVIRRRFIDQYVQELYTSQERQSWLLAVLSMVAVSIACLGLFGLAAAAAEQRTQEIGVRKAMGAGTAEVMRLLLWQFAQPVLWANLIAWPLAGFLMHLWLQGFAYRIDLEPWLFIASSVAALLIALLTVGAHCYLVARAKPVAALRYE